MPDYAIYFSSYFFDTIPDRNYTNASSVPRDECKISCFWKSNHSLSFKLSLFYNTNCNIISSSLSKNSLSTTWPLIEMTGQQHYHLYNSIPSLVSKQSANRSTTIPFVPLWHHTDTVLSVKYRQYLSNHFQRWNCSVSRFYNCSTAIPSKSPQNRF